MPKLPNLTQNDREKLEELAKQYPVLLEVITHEKCGHREVIFIGNNAEWDSNYEASTISTISLGDHIYRHMEELVECCSTTINCPRTACKGCTTKCQHNEKGGLIHEKNSTLQKS